MATEEQTENQPQLPDIQAEDQTVDNNRKNAASLTEDPDYKKIRDELDAKWRERTGLPWSSGEYQDYSVGNPADPNAHTLNQDTERQFREQYPERAKQYDDQERIRVYQDITLDPAYKKMSEQALERTNADSAVRNAGKNGQSWGDTWQQAYALEENNAREIFARQFPEKAQGYARVWEDFVANHPQAGNLNTHAWMQWCYDNKVSLSMSEYRNMAFTVQSIDRRRKIEIHRQDAQKTASKLESLRDRLGLSEAPVEDTPIARQAEQLTADHLEEVAQQIRTIIPPEIQSADRAFLEEEHKQLDRLPYMPGQDAKEFLDRTGIPEGMRMVKTEAIIGSVSPAFDDWSTEYDKRKGRAVDIATTLQMGTPEAVDRVFHVRDPKQGVRLKKISGPGGDIFFAMDGTHRVAGAKLLRLPEIPANIEDVTNAREVYSTDPLLRSEWEKKIRRGLIQGDVKEEFNKSVGKKVFKLTLKKQALPWMCLPQQRYLKMTQLYLKRYPESFDDIRSPTTKEKIPKEALTDEVAMNYYLADRWDEYKKETYI